MRARQRQIGLVGVDDPRVALGHEKPVRAGVGDHLGDVVLDGLTGKLKKSDGIGEKRENADHGEHGQQRHEQAARGLGRQEGEGARDRDQGGRQKQDEAGATGPFAAVDGGDRGLAHERLSSVAPIP